MARSSDENLQLLRETALEFGRDFERIAHPALLGITDGKAVGTYIEQAFKLSLVGAGVVGENEGNAAKGIDLPSLNTDIKVTSSRQPQSSVPFKSFKQKIEGLGYDLILFVYSKLDEAGECSVKFPAIRHIPARLTADFQTTKGLRRLIMEDDGNADDVFAFLADRNIPTDEVALRAYAELLLDNPPAQGVLTMSNALQWRMQYSRVVAERFEGVSRIL